MMMVFDIGGTAIKSGIFNKDHLWDVKSTPTEANKGGGYIVELIIDIISSYKEKYKIDKIAISTAGQVDPNNGIVLFSNNIPEYTGTHLADILQKRFSLPVKIQNDVYCMALGETFFGAGKELNSFVCLTYGTGIGGAIVLNRELYYGNDYLAGEFGAILTHPENSGLTSDYYEGGYEKYASTTSLVQMAKKHDELLQNGKQIFARIEENAIKQIVDNWIEEIVFGLQTITYVLNPEAIIMGGGIMEQPYVVDAVQERLTKRIIPNLRGTRVLKAELGNMAGMYGASTLYRRTM